MNDVIMRWQLTENTVLILKLLPSLYFIKTRKSDRKMMHIGYNYGSEYLSLSLALKVVGEDLHGIRSLLIW